MHTAGRSPWVNEVVDVVIRRGREVVDESPASILLRDNTNARTAKVAVWGSVEGASHSIFSELLPEGLVNYFWMLKCRCLVRCCEMGAGAVVANVEAIGQGVHKLGDKV